MSLKWKIFYKPSDLLCDFESNRLNLYVILHEFDSVNIKPRFTCIRANSSYYFFQCVKIFCIWFFMIFLSKISWFLDFVFLISLLPLTVYVSACNTFELFVYKSWLIWMHKCSHFVFYHYFGKFEKLHHRD